MILYLVGMSCVGKTTVGRLLAEEVGFKHFDLDTEVENYYQKPIERIQDECLTMNGYREKASVVLGNLLSMDDDLVISGPPSGLMFSYLRAYKKIQNQKGVALNIS